MFLVILTVRIVGEIFSWTISWGQSLLCAESRSVEIFRISHTIFEIYRKGKLKIIFYSAHNSAQQNFKFLKHKRLQKKL
jgi:hypothetical protein